MSDKISLLPNQTKTMKNVLKFNKKKVKGGVLSPQDEMNARKKRNKAKKMSSASKKRNR